MAGFGESTIGRIRKTNEDSILVENRAVGALPNLYIVADGMGGHLAGEVASGMAIRDIRDFLLQNHGFENVFDALEKAVDAANKSIFASASKDIDQFGMGTTLLAATVMGKKAHIINVGDSRLYVINPGKDKIEQITVDHSYVMELVRIGRITKDEAMNHPKKNIITRALGIERDVKSDRFIYDLAEGDYLMLCSDGLSNMLTDEDILNICQKDSNINNIVKRLIESANEKGGIDNISVIIYSENDGV